MNTLFRVFVSVCVIVVVAHLLSKFIPACATSAFVIEGIGITWMMLVAGSVGVLAWRSTK